MKKSSLLKNSIKTVVPFLLGMFILWLLYRKTNLGDLWSIIKSANFGIIAFSLLFGLAGNITRALRWELLIRSLGYKPRTMSLVYAVLGNYAINFALPRAGEVWRCGVVAKYDKVPFTKAFGTLLIDRLFDVFAVLGIFILGVLLNLDFFISYFGKNPDYGHKIIALFSSRWLYGGLLFLAAIIVLVFRIFKNNVWIIKIRGFLASVKRDILLVARMKEKKRFILYTILIWFAYYLYFYICFYAFSFTRELGWVAGLIVFAMSSLGVAAPVQGGIGAWHFMVISSLLVFGVSYEQGSAFAGAVFTIQTIWLILCGVFGIVAVQYVKRDKVEEQPSEQSEQ